MSHLDMTSFDGAALPIVPEDDLEPVPASRAPRAPRPSDSNGPPPRKVRITCQFRDGQAMVYDLNVGERRIEVRLQPRTTPPDGWSIALIVKGEDRAFDASGATRPLALSTLEETSGAVFGGDDWEAIRDALTGVRAL